MFDSQPNLGLGQSLFGRRKISDQVLPSTSPQDSRFVSPSAGTQQNVDDGPMTTFNSHSAAKKQIDSHLATATRGQKRAREGSLSERLQPPPEKRHKHGDHLDCSENELCDLMSGLSIQVGLFILPAEIRNMIYEMVFQDEYDVLTVKSSIFPDPPPLLLVSKQVRKEAGYVLYSAFQFRVYSAAWNTDPLLAMWRKRKAVLPKLNIEMRYQIVPYGDPNWRGLLFTCRRTHEGHFEREDVDHVAQLPFTTPRGRVLAQTLRAALALAKHMGDSEWYCVDRRLERYHFDLIMIDSEWT